MFRPKREIDYLLDPCVIATTDEFEPESTNTIDKLSHEAKDDTKISVPSTSFHKESVERISSSPSFYKKYVEGISYDRHGVLVTNGTPAGAKEISHPLFVSDEAKIYLFKGSLPVNMGYEEGHFILHPNEESEDISRTPSVLQLHDSELPFPELEKDASGIVMIKPFEEMEGKCACYILCKSGDENNTLIEVTSLGTEEGANKLLICYNSEGEQVMKVIKVCSSDLDETPVVSLSDQNSKVITQAQDDVGEVKKVLKSALKPSKALEQQILSVMRKVVKMIDINCVCREEKCICYKFAVQDEKKLLDTLELPFVWELPSVKYGKFEEFDDNEIIVKIIRTPSEVTLEATEELKTKMVKNVIFASTSSVTNLETTYDVPLEDPNKPKKQLKGRMSSEIVPPWSSMPVSDSEDETPSDEEEKRETRTLPDERIRSVDDYEEFESYSESEDEFQSLCIGKQFKLERSASMDTLLSFPLTDSSSELSPIKEREGNKPREEHELVKNDASHLDSNAFEDFKDSEAHGGSEEAVYFKNAVEILNSKGPVKNIAKDSGERMRSIDSDKLVHSIDSDKLVHSKESVENMHYIVSVQMAYFQDAADQVGVYISSIPHTPISCFRPLKTWLPKCTVEEVYPKCPWENSKHSVGIWSSKCFEDVSHSERSVSILHSKPSAGSMLSKLSAGSMHSKPSVGSMHSKPSVGIQDSKPSAGSIHSKPSAGSMHSKRPVQFPDAVYLINMDDTCETIMDQVGSYVATIPSKPVAYFGTFRKKCELNLLHSGQHADWDDLYDEGIADAKYLNIRPNNIMVIGKQGTGRTKLASMIAEYWGPIHLTPGSLIRKVLRGRKTRNRRSFKYQLKTTSSISGRNILDLIRDGTNAPDVKHRGYVIDELPFLPCPNQMDAVEQINFIGKWRNKPNIFIYIECSDNDVLLKRSNVLYDFQIGNYHPADMKMYEKAYKNVASGEKYEIDIDLYEEEFQKTKENLSKVQKKYLIHRHEALPHKISKEVKLYNVLVKPVVEAFLKSKPSELVIRLDGRLPMSQMFQCVKARLEEIGIQRHFIPRPLIDPQNEDDQNILDTCSEIPRKEWIYYLNGKNCPGIFLRWHMSVWDTYCPVALCRGRLQLGKPEFTAGYMDKMFLMSSKKAFDKFKRNPRPYLLPPNPLPPARIVVIGSPYSGKTTLCNSLAPLLKAKVIDFKEVVERYISFREYQMKNFFPKKSDVKLKKKDIQAMEKHREKEAWRQCEVARAITLARQIRQAWFSLFLPKSKKLKWQRKRGQSDEEPLFSQQSDTDKYDMYYKQHLRLRKLQERRDEVVGEARDKVPVTASSKKRVRFVTLENPIPEPDPDIPKWIVKMPPWDLTNPVKIRRYLPYILRKPFRFPKPSSKDPSYVYEFARIAACEQAEELTVEIKCDLLLDAITRVEADRRYRGWIIDNMPMDIKIWECLTRTENFPDYVLCLLDSPKEGVHCWQRFQMNEEERVAEQSDEEDEESVEYEDESWDDEESDDEDEESDDEEESDNEEEESDNEEEESDDDEEESDEEESDDDEEESDDDEESDEEEEESEDDDEEESEEDDADSEEELDDPAALRITESEEELLKRSDSTESMKEEINSNECECELKQDFDDHVNQFVVDFVDLYEYIKETKRPVPIKIKVKNLLPSKILEIALNKLYATFKLKAREFEEEDDNEMTVDANELADEFTKDLKEYENYKDYSPGELLEKYMHLGEIGTYCPVTLYKDHMFTQGSDEIRAIYRDKIYYLQSEVYRTQFVKNPEKYLSFRWPVSPPPLRICITGPLQSGKSTLMAELHKKIPEYVGIEMEEKIQETLENMGYDRLGQKFDDILRPVESLVYFPSLDDIVERRPSMEIMNMLQEVRKYLDMWEKIPEHFLDAILPFLWKKEPFKSRNVFLAGFPYSTQDIEYLKENNLHIDAIISLKVEIEDVMERRLNILFDKWKARFEEERAKREIEEKERLESQKDMIAVRRAELEEKRRLILEGVIENEFRPISPTESLSSESTRGFSLKPKRNIEDEIREIDITDEDGIDRILSVQFFNVSEEQNWESEEDALNRIQTNLEVSYDSQKESLEEIANLCEDLSIKYVEVEADIKGKMARAALKAIKEVAANRQGIFERTYELTLAHMEGVLKSGYFYLSKYNFWDLVEVSNNKTLHSNDFGRKSRNMIFPVVHRRFLYLFGSDENRKRFCSDPLKYLQLKKPEIPIPVRVAVIGPPLSGKTTLAELYAKRFYLSRISVEEAILRAMELAPDSHLGSVLKKILCNGETTPPNLVIDAIIFAFSDARAAIQGYVLDGFPNTVEEAQILEDHGFYPLMIIMLESNEQDVLNRGQKLIENLKASKPRPEIIQLLQFHTSRYKEWMMNETAVRDYYQEQHANVYTMPREQTPGQSFVETLSITSKLRTATQAYLINIRDGRPASVELLGVTPKEYATFAGPYGNFCPVCLSNGRLRQSLVITEVPRKGLILFEDSYHWVCEEHFEIFMDDPTPYVNPLNRLEFLSKAPLRILTDEAKTYEPSDFGFGGFCVVSYAELMNKTPSLHSARWIKGLPEYAIKYDGKFYCFASEENLNKFCKDPTKYLDYEYSLNALELPDRGMLDLVMSDILSDALILSQVLKPKYPELTILGSEFQFIYLYFKAHNPKSSQEERDYYSAVCEDFLKPCNHLYSVFNLSDRFMKNCDITKRMYVPKERTDELVQSLTKVSNILFGNPSSWMADNMEKVSSLIPIIKKIPIGTRAQLKYPCEEEYYLPATKRFHHDTFYKNLVSALLKLPVLARVPEFAQSQGVSKSPDIIYRWSKIQLTLMGLTDILDISEFPLSVNIPLTWKPLLSDIPVKLKGPGMLVHPACLELCPPLKQAHTLKHVLCELEHDVGSVYVNSGASGAWIKHFVVTPSQTQLTSDQLETLYTSSADPCHSLKNTMARSSQADIDDDTFQSDFEDDIHLLRSLKDRDLKERMPSRKRASSVSRSQSKPTSETRVNLLPDVISRDVSILHQIAPLLYCAKFGVGELLKSLKSPRFSPRQVIRFVNGKPCSFPVSHKPPSSSSTSLLESLKPVDEDADAIAPSRKEKLMKLPSLQSSSSSSSGTAPLSRAPSALDFQREGSVSSSGDDKQDGDFLVHRVCSTMDINQPSDILLKGQRGLIKLPTLHQHTKAKTNGESLSTDVLQSVGRPSEVKPGTSKQYTDSITSSGHESSRKHTKPESVHPCPMHGFPSHHRGGHHTDFEYTPQSLLRHYSGPRHRPKQDQGHLSGLHSMLVVDKYPQSPEFEDKLSEVERLAEEFDENIEIHMKLMKEMRDLYPLIDPTDLSDAYPSFLYPCSDSERYKQLLTQRGFPYPQMYAISPPVDFERLSGEELEYIEVDSVCKPKIPKYGGPLPGLYIYMPDLHSLLCIDPEVRKISKHPALTKSKRLLRKSKIPSSEMKSLRNVVEFDDEINITSTEVRRKSSTSEKEREICQYYGPPAGAYVRLRNFPSPICIEPEIRRPGTRIIMRRLKRSSKEYKLPPPALIYSEHGTEFKDKIGISSDRKFSAREREIPSYYGPPPGTYVKLHNFPSPVCIEPEVRRSSMHIQGIHKEYKIPRPALIYSERDVEFEDQIGISFDKVVRKYSAAEELQEREIPSYYGPTPGTYVKLRHFPFSICIEPEIRSSKLVALRRKKRFLKESKIPAVQVPETSSYRGPLPGMYIEVPGFPSGVCIDPEVMKPPISKEPPLVEMERSKSVTIGDVTETTPADTHLQEPEFSPYTGPAPGSIVLHPEFPSPICIDPEVRKPSKRKPVRLVKIEGVTTITTADRDLQEPEFLPYSGPAPGKYVELTEFPSPICIDPEVMKPPLSKNPLGKVQFGGVSEMTIPDIDVQQQPAPLPYSGPAPGTYTKVLEYPSPICVDPEAISSSEAVSSSEPSKKPSTVDSKLSLFQKKYSRSVKLDKDIKVIRSSFPFPTPLVPPYGLRTFTSLPVVRFQASKQSTKIRARIHPQVFLPRYVPSWLIPKRQPPPKKSVVQESSSSSSSSSLSSLSSSEEEKEEEEGPKEETLSLYSFSDEEIDDESLGSSGDEEEKSSSELQVMPPPGTWSTLRDIPDPIRIDPMMQHELRLWETQSLPELTALRSVVRFEDEVREKSLDSALFNVRQFSGPPPGTYRSVHGCRFPTAICSEPEIRKPLISGEKPFRVRRRFEGAVRFKDWLDQEIPLYRGPTPGTPTISPEYGRLISADPEAKKTLKSKRKRSLEESAKMEEMMPLRSVVRFDDEIDNNEIYRGPAVGTCQWIPHFASKKINMDPKFKIKRLQKPQTKEEILQKSRELRKKHPPQVEKVEVGEKEEGEGESVTPEELLERRRAEKRAARRAARHAERHVARQRMKQLAKMRAEALKKHVRFGDEAELRVIEYEDEDDKEEKDKMEIDTKYSGPSPGSYVWADRFDLPICIDPEVVKIPELIKERKISLEEAGKSLNYMASLRSVVRFEDEIDQLQHYGPEPGTPMPVPGFDRPICVEPEAIRSQESIKESSSESMTLMKSGRRVVKFLDEIEPNDPLYSGPMLDTDVLPALPTTDFASSVCIDPERITPPANRFALFLTEMKALRHDVTFDDEVDLPEEIPFNFRTMKKPDSSFSKWQLRTTYPAMDDLVFPKVLPEVKTKDEKIEQVGYENFLKSKEERLRNKYFTEYPMRFFPNMYYRVCTYEHVDFEEFECCFYPEENVVYPEHTEEAKLSKLRYQEQFQIIEPQKFCPGPESIYHQSIPVTTQLSPEERAYIEEGKVPKESPPEGPEYEIPENVIPPSPYYIDMRKKPLYTYFDATTTIPEKQEESTALPKSLVSQHRVTPGVSYMDEVLKQVHPRDATKKLPPEPQEIRRAHTSVKVRRRAASDTTFEHAKEKCRKTQEIHKAHSSFGVQRGVASDASYIQESKKPMHSKDTEKRTPGICKVQSEQKFILPEMYKPKVKRPYDKYEEVEAFDERNYTALDTLRLRGIMFGGYEENMEIKKVAHVTFNLDPDIRERPSECDTQPVVYAKGFSERDVQTFRIADLGFMKNVIDDYEEPTPPPPKKVESILKTKFIRLPKPTFKEESEEEQSNVDPKNYPKPVLRHRKRKGLKSIFRDKSQPPTVTFVEDSIRESAISTEIAPEQVDVDPRERFLEAVETQVFERTFKPKSSVPPDTSSIQETPDAPQEEPYLKNAISKAITFVDEPIICQQQFSKDDRDDDDDLVCVLSPSDSREGIHSPARFYVKPRQRTRSFLRKKRKPVKEPEEIPEKEPVKELQEQPGKEFKTQLADIEGSASNELVCLLSPSQVTPREESSCGSVTSVEVEKKEEEEQEEEEEVEEEEDEENAEDEVEDEEKMEDEERVKDEEKVEEEEDEKDMKCLLTPSEAGQEEESISGLAEHTPSKHEKYIPIRFEPRETKKKHCYPIEVLYAKEHVLLSGIAKTTLPTITQPPERLSELEIDTSPDLKCLLSPSEAGQEEESISGRIEQTPSEREESKKEEHKQQQMEGNKKKKKKQKEGDGQSEESKKRKKKKKKEEVNVQWPPKPDPIGIMKHMQARSHLQSHATTTLPTIERPPRRLSEFEIEPVSDDTVEITEIELLSTGSPQGIQSASMSPVLGKVISESSKLKLPSIGIKSAGTESVSRKATLKSTKLNLLNIDSSKGVKSADTEYVSSYATLKSTKLKLPSIGSNEEIISEFDDHTIRRCPAATEIPTIFKHFVFGDKDKTKPWKFRSPAIEPILPMLEPKAEPQKEDKCPICLRAPHHKKEEPEVEPPLIQKKRITPRSLEKMEMSERQAFLTTKAILMKDPAAKLYQEYKEKQEKQEAQIREYLSQITPHRLAYRDDILGQPAKIPKPKPLAFSPLEQAVNPSDEYFPQMLKYLRKYEAKRRLHFPVPPVPPNSPVCSVRTRGLKEKVKAIKPMSTSVAELAKIPKPEAASVSPLGLSTPPSHEYFPELLKGTHKYEAKRHLNFPVLPLPPNSPVSGARTEGQEAKVYYVLAKPKSTKAPSKSYIPRPIPDPRATPSKLSLMDKSKPTSTPPKLSPREKKPTAKPSKLFSIGKSKPTRKSRLPVIKPDSTSSRPVSPTLENVSRGISKQPSVAKSERVTIFVDEKKLEKRRVAATDKMIENYKKGKPLFDTKSFLKNIDSETEIKVYEPDRP